MSNKTSIEYLERKIHGNKVIISVFPVMPTKYKFKHLYIYIKAKITLKIYCYKKAIKEFIDEYKNIKNLYSNITRIQALDMASKRLEEKG